jgi:transposase-like protein
MYLGNDETAILNQVENAFRAFRAKNPYKGMRIPEELRELTLSAVKSEVTVRKIARAAGIEPKAIRNWRNALPKEPEVAGPEAMPKLKLDNIIGQEPAKDDSPKAKRLNLVEALAPQKVISKVIGKENVVCIRLVSGVEIDLPRAELTCEMLATLNSIGTLP